MFTDAENAFIGAQIGMTDVEGTEKTNSRVKGNWGKPLGKGWQCKCGFRNVTWNQMCGGTGRLGCNIGKEQEEQGKEQESPRGSREVNQTGEQRGADREGKQTVAL